MATNFPRNRHGNSLYRNNRGNAGHGNSNGSGYGNGNGGGFGYGYGYEQRTASAKEQVYEILHVLFKRWRQIALIFAIIFIPFLLLTTVLTRTTYVATAKVNISTDRA